MQLWFAIPKSPDFNVLAGLVFASKEVILNNPKYDFVPGWLQSLPVKVKFTVVKIYLQKIITKNQFIIQNIDLESLVIPCKLALTVALSLLKLSEIVHSF